MKNWKISTKLSVAFGVLCVAVALMAALSIGSMASIYKATDSLGGARRIKLTTIAEINTETSDYRIAEATAVLENDPERIRREIDTAAKIEAAIEKNLAYLTAKANKPASVEALKVFKSHWRPYLDQSRRTLQFASRNQDAEALASFSASRKIFDVANDDAAKLQHVQVSLMEAELAEAGSTYSIARGTFLAMTVLVIALTMFMLVALIRGLAKPLSSMTGTMGRLAAGDLSAEVDVEERADEVGQLATALVAFRNQLAAADRAKTEQTTLIVDSIGTALSKLAQGDLVARVETDLVGPFAKLKSDFNTASSSLQSTLAQVSQTISGINNGAGDISQASDDLSQRTEQQAASLEQTAAAMEEITSTVRETAAHASKANEAVRAARQQADHSGEVVGTAIQAMGEIERTSNEISEIISVIDGIAFQTNLLALNAGVEAARAGDAGKGFAVVASEVRALAQRTAEAAKDVKARITASGEQVKSGVQLVGQAGSSLQQIMERIAEVDQLMNSIATATEQQATGLQQVNTAVSEMDSVTQQNAAMVEESTAAARSLASDADELARQISRFHTGQAMAAAPAPRSAPVHQLQARAAEAGRKIAQVMRRSGSAAVAVEEDWSEF